MSLQRPKLFYFRRIPNIEANSDSSGCNGSSSPSLGGFGVGTTMSLPHFALRALLLGTEASSNDAVRLAAAASDPAAVEQQYSRFKFWISESPDAHKPELAQLLYPMFTHLYLELVCAGQRQAANKFHKRHQSTFLGNAEFANFIRQLSAVQSAADVGSEPSVASFHADKYSVTLSTGTFHFLLRFGTNVVSPRHEINRDAFPLQIPAIL